jgi:hypothetical protein
MATAWRGGKSLVTFRDVVPADDARTDAFRIPSARRHQRSRVLVEGDSPEGPQRRETSGQIDATDARKTVLDECVVGRWAVRQGTRGYRGKSFGLLLVLSALLLPACASVRVSTEESLDQGQLFLSRTIADTVDRVDKILGDPRVEDRQRKVRVATGVQCSLTEGKSPAFQATFGGRFPLPALERMAHLFLDLGGDVQSTAANPVALQGGQPSTNYQALLEYLSLSKWPVAYGFKLQTFWQGGPQTNIGPFFRWEGHLDSIRLYASQEFFYRSDRAFGETTGFAADRLLTETMHLRFQNSAGAETVGSSGVDLQHAGVLLRSFGEYGALSQEIGVRYTTGPETNGQYYARVKWVDRVWRPWLEYQVNPGVALDWGSRDPEFAASLGLRVIFEDFLRP